MFGNLDHPPAQQRRAVGKGKVGFVELKRCEGGIFHQSPKVEDCMELKECDDCVDGISEGKGGRVLYLNMAHYNVMLC